MSTSDNSQILLDEERSADNKSELSKLSIKDLFYKYIRFLPFFILSVALALFIAFAYLRYATRIYSSSGSLQIKNEVTGRSDDKIEDLLMGTNRSEGIQSEIEVLKSKPLMARVVERLDLQISYTAIGRIKDENVYKKAPFILNVFELADSSRSFSMNIKFIGEKEFRVNNESAVFKFDQVFKNQFGVFSLLRKSNPSGGEYTVSWRPTSSVAGSFAHMVNVFPKAGGTGLIINMQTTNPQLSADIVNSLMVQYDSLSIEQNNFSTDQMLAFIDIRLDKLKNELDSIQQIALEYRQKNNLLIDVNAQSSSFFQKIISSDEAINQQQMNLSIADMIDGYLQDKKNQFSEVVVPSSLGLEDATLNGLVSGYNKAQLERRSLLESNIPPDNPAVKEAEAIIEQQRQSVLESLKNLKYSYNSAVSTFRKRSGSELSQLEELPYATKELLNLERQITTKLGLYGVLEGKREEAAISRASTISNSKIIDQASPSSVPVKPNDTTVQLIALIIGLAIPAAIIFIMEILNDKVNTRFDIEKITNVPILGEVGHSGADKVLVVNKTSRRMVAEQFRIIRSNLQYFLNKTERPVILVTSSFSGEGKSFVSTNMGAVMALAGKKTIVLEFDIRKPKILTGLGLERRQGITNFLIAKAKLEDLITPVPGHENLYVLPCGPTPPNPAELLLDERVAEMFQWLRQHFDVVIIDTAPIGMVSDAMTLGKFADCTLYLVRQGYTFKKQIGLIDDLYQQRKLPALSIVVNDVKMKAGYGYYGYGRYGYGYGYGNNGYYEEEQPGKGRLEKFVSRMTFRKNQKRKV